MRSLQLVVFDIDGTLVSWRGERYIWNVILKSPTLLVWNKNARLDYLSGNLSYCEWHDSLFFKMAASGVTKGDLVQLMRESLCPVETSQLLLTSLRKRGVIQAVLSGSLSLALEVAGICRDHFAVIRSHVLDFDSAGLIKGWSVNRHGGDRDKPAGLFYLCEQLRVSPRETLYVGDGFNDLSVINALNFAGGIGYAIPPLSNYPDLLVRPENRCRSLAELRNLIDHEFN